MQLMANNNNKKNIFFNAKIFLLTNYPAKRIWLTKKFDFLLTKKGLECEHVSVQLINPTTRETKTEKTFASKFKWQVLFFVGKRRDSKIC